MNPPYRWRMKKRYQDTHLKIHSRSNFLKEFNRKIDVSLTEIETNLVYGWVQDKQKQGHWYGKTKRLDFGLGQYITVLQVEVYVTMACAVEK
jgi:hypothetical protein